MAIGANWGATADERAMSMACDELLADAPVRLHRAVPVRAPAPLVFRWLCQLKLAPYSYDLIDNLGRTSPRALVAGAEHLEVGQRFMSIFSLTSFLQDQHITLRSRRTAVTYAVIPADGHTRLLARVLFDPPGGRLGAALAGRALTLGDLVMMRKQLLTLKLLAERDATAPSL
ncbi:MAG: hypothetical protein ABSB69_17585 [Solirubrobacteraceae bacterium]